MLVLGILDCVYADQNANFNFEIQVLLSETDKNLK